MYNWHQKLWHKDLTLATVTVKSEFVAAATITF